MHRGLTSIEFNNNHHWHANPLTYHCKPKLKVEIEASLANQNPTPTCMFRSTMNIPTNGTSDDTSSFSLPMITESTISVTSSSSLSTTTTSSPTLRNKQFHMFMNLQYELQIMILSYVATAPFENRSIEDDNETSILHVPSIPGSITCRSLMYTSTLTHILPCVCKAFYDHHCKDDTLWKDALLHQLLFHEPKLWYNALQNIVTTNGNTSYTILNHHNIIYECNTNYNALEPNEQPVTSKSIYQLIERAYNIIVSSTSTASSVSPVSNSITKTNGYYYYLYRTILNTQLRVKCPVFIMNGDVVLNELYGLHLFEYRYRYMISQLIQQHDTIIQQNITDIDLSSITNIDRSTLLEKYPIYFIHANRGNVGRSEMAVIVQLIHCTTHPDGRADIVIKPVHFIWIERSWLYTNSNPTGNTSATISTSSRNSTNVVSSSLSSPPHNLYYAQGLKMGYEATNAMHYLQRQETLTTVMERLIASGLLVQERRQQQQEQDLDNDDDHNGNDVDVDNDINALRLAGIHPVHLHFLTQMNNEENDSSDDDDNDDVDGDNNI
jgi:hypothetical protein